MSDGGNRIGTISSADPETGMASVIFEDRDGEVTELLPYATFNGEYSPPQPGAKVIVAHLSNGGEMGVILGTYWNERNAAGNPGTFHKALGGKAYVNYKDGVLTIAAEHIRFCAADDGEDFTAADLMGEIRGIKKALGIT